MLKILIKKQLRELTSFLFRDKKNGSLRSRRGVIYMAVSYVAVLAILGFSMAGIADFLCGMLCSVGADWVYFAFSSTVSAIAGLVIGLFSTYAMLYGSKDNDMLFSMPIPPRAILISRMIAAYLTSFVYSAIIYLPFTVTYIINGYGNALTALLAVLSYPFLALTVTVLTCLFGWIVAMIAPHIRHKSIVSSALAAMAIIGYYAITFRMESFFTLLVTKLDVINSLADSWLMPLALFGKGVSGDIPSFLLSTLLAIAAAALTCFFMGHNFAKMVNVGKNQAKVIYHEKAEKVRSADGALFAMEVRRFVQTPIYLMNCGLGVIFMLAVGIVMLLRGDLFLAEMGGAEAETVKKLLAPGCLGVIMMLVSMDSVAAPSVSLEGKNYWIVRSLPVDGRKCLHAKEKLHLAVNLVPALVGAALLAIAFRFDFLTALFLFAAVTAFNFFAADVALILGLRFANLEWTNPTVPVKQGTAVGLSLLVLMIAAMAGSALGCLMSYYTVPALGLFEIAGLYAAAYCILHYYLETRCPKQFERLE